MTNFGRTNLVLENLIRSTWSNTSFMPKVLFDVHFQKNQDSEVDNSRRRLSYCRILVATLNIKLIYLGKTMVTTRILKEWENATPRIRPNYPRIAPQVPGTLLTLRDCNRRFQTHYTYKKQTKPNHSSPTCVRKSRVYKVLRVSKCFFGHQSSDQ